MEWTQLISSLGFPIVCCFFLFKQNIDIMTKHDSEMSKITEALNNNTLAITRLCDKIGGEKIADDLTETKQNS